MKDKTSLVDSVLPLRSGQKGEEFGGKNYVSCHVVFDPNFDESMLSEKKNCPFR